VTLSTTNPTWPHMGSNASHLGEKPATSRLNYNMVDAVSFKLCVHSTRKEWL
jgi:hypothetical protein